MAQTKTAMKMLCKISIIHTWADLISHKKKHKQITFSHTYQTHTLMHTNAMWTGVTECEMDAAPPAPVPSALASWRWSQLFPSTPLPPQNPARFDISQPLATQTSGSYYSTEHATKRHFHNETSHFVSAPCFLLLLSPFVPTCSVFLTSDPV